LANKGEESRHLAMAETNEFNLNTDRLILKLNRDNLLIVKMFFVMLFMLETGFSHLKKK